MKERRKRFWSNLDIQLNEESTRLSTQLHGLSCPECKSRKFTKSGKEKGNQRYRCSRCGKHFRSTTGNTIHHLHLKPKIQEYINCMNEGLSLRKTAVRCDISLRTAFRWRHRFLKAMQNQTEKIEQSDNVVSAFVLPFSNKSTVKPNSNLAKITSLLQVSLTGQTRIKVLGKHGQTASKLLNSINDNTVFLKSKAIPKLLKAQSSEKISQDQICQTQKMHIEIKNWLMKFRGVATKYLQNYWEWFTLLKKLQTNRSDQLQYMYSCF